MGRARNATLTAALLAAVAAVGAARATAAPVYGVTIGTGR
jgi:hypothetical protein